MSHGSHREADASAGLVREAASLADEADARAGVVTRAAATDELDGVLHRFESTWGPGRGPDRSMLQALDHAGNTVLVAVPAPGRVDAAAELAEPGTAPLGATLGFLGWAGGPHLHSHMNAVAPEARGRGVGVALKLRQRAICLANGVDEIRWTFDPLIRRNARMNLVRLGAEVSAFLPDFYGDLADAITGADASDRFEVRWRLASPRVRWALARRPAPVWHAEGGLALVADFEAVRAAQPEAAAELRAASRTAFEALADGRLRPELSPEGDYVFTADDVDRAAD